jgi:hypothetical protein
MSVLQPTHFPSKAHLYIINKATWCLMPTRWRPIASGPRISKATHTLFISLARASCQRVFPLFWSMSIACLTEVGTSMPYLWLVLQTLEFTAKIMISLFFKTWWTHHAKVGSSPMLQVITYLVTCTGLDYFEIFNSIHWCMLLAHWTRNFQPWIIWRIQLVSVFVMKYLLAILVASPELLWSTIS